MQMQSLSEYTKLWSVNDMLRSFDLENNHENLEKKKIIHLITFFNQLHGHHAITGKKPCQFVFGRDNIYDPKYCLQSKLGLNTKNKTRHYK
jgi:hypothetical protein